MVNALKSTTILVGDLGPEVSSKAQQHQATFHVASREALSTTLRSLPPSSLGSLDIVIASADIPLLFDPLALAGLVITLQEQATLRVKVLPDNDNANTIKARLQVVTTAFLLAGLTAQGERRDADNARILTATKPAPKASATIRRFEPRAVTINLDDDSDDDFDDDALVDEDTLLDNGLLSPPPDVDLESRQKNAGGDDGRKPCDNCSCGRAELQKAAQKDVVVAATPSACGNCGKGDAFRCGGCPHLGKAAFKEGEQHLVLDLEDDF